MTDQEQINSILASLGISTELIAARSLVLCPEAQELEVVAVDDDGREHLLAPAASAAWREMRAAALSDGIGMSIVSAFRTIDRQAEIVRAKLASGLTLEDILCVSAPPGYSEHHTGLAIDVNAEGVAALEPEFKNTAAFRWLCRSAGQFGFVLSFPADNLYGYAYEPWHWCYKPAGA